MKRMIALGLFLALAAMLAPGFAEPAEVDLDLSEMPASVAYAQAIAMQREPEAYAGQVVRVAGIFNYSEARQRGVVIIADRSGCCETFMDFVCADELLYPDDYPEAGKDITVVGTFTTYMEGSQQYCQLKDAEVKF